MFYRTMNEANFKDATDFQKIQNVCNQEFFRAWESSWNQGTSIKIHLQHKKEKPRREKISGFFAWKLLKIAFEMNTLSIDDHNQSIFFHKLWHFFPIFEKGQRRPPLLPPSSYAPNVLTMGQLTGYFLLTLKSIITCPFLALLLQHLSSSYQNTAANYFHFLPLEFLDYDWLKFHGEFDCKLQTITSEINCL